MPLTDIAIRNAKPADRPRRIADEAGLYLEVSPAGGKLWRLKYRFGGKEKRLALGVYPIVGLKEARDRRDAARKLLAAGVDPGEHRKAEKVAGERRAASSFEVIAREWFGKLAPTWASTHSIKVIQRLEDYLFPWLGARPIADVAAPELLACLRRVEERGAFESAHRTLQHCGQIFRYAIATGRAERNPAADLRGALSPVNPTHRAAITNPAEIGALLRAIHDYHGTPVTRCALRLAPMLFVRPGELRTMGWGELDLDANEWNIPAGKMKMREPHLVPLAAQAVAILRELQPLTGNSQYVFPCARSPRRPLSNMALNAALRRMGYGKDEMTGHGFRAMARTVLDEVLGFRPDFIEQQLAHAVRDPLGRAYNRTKHLPERRKMMQAWADYLDGLRDGRGHRREADRAGKE